MLGSVVILALLSCREPTVGVSRSTPVVHLTLVAGESLQVATVTVATPADSVLPREGVPAPPGSVDLRLEDTRGSVWPVTATPTPGRFHVAMTPVPGERYRLRGNALGRGVAATTRVPSRIELGGLPRDTIAVADSMPCSFVRAGYLCFPLAVESDERLDVACVAPPEPWPVCFSDRGDSYLHLERRPTAYELLVAGYTEDTARPRLGETAVFFGVMVIARRTVLIP
jgi:hypothetical protein